MRGQLLDRAGAEIAFDARAQGLERVYSEALQKFGEYPDLAFAFVVKIEQQDAPSRFSGFQVFFDLAQRGAVRAYEMRLDAEFLQGGHVAFSFDKHDFAVQ